MLLFWPVVNSLESLPGNVAQTLTWSALRPRMLVRAWVPTRKASFGLAGLITFGEMIPPC